jgi:hypothetical protein
MPQPFPQMWGQMPPAVTPGMQPTAFGGIPTGAGPSTARSQYQPNTGDDVKRANDIQDAQLQLADRAIRLAGTGNLSDAIMAKHIRSTIAAMSGASTARAGAVNPLQTQQMAGATQERNVDVQESSARHTTNVGAETQRRQQDIEAYFKAPEMQKNATMAQLQHLAAFGTPEQRAQALQTMQDFADVSDKTATPILGQAGDVPYVLKGKTWYKTPGAPAGAEGDAPMTPEERRARYFQLYGTNPAAPAQ